MLPAEGTLDRDQDQVSPQQEGGSPHPLQLILVLKTGSLHRRSRRWAGEIKVRGLRALYPRHPRPTGMFLTFRTGSRCWHCDSQAVPDLTSSGRAHALSSSGASEVSFLFSTRTT